MKKLLFLIFISQWCFGQSTMGLVNFGKNQFLTYDADYQRVLSYAQQQGIALPSLACQAAQNTLMSSIKSNIGLSAFDQIKIMVGDSPANFTLINWVNPSVLNTIPTRKPLYTPFVGWTVDASNSSNSACLNMGAVGPNFTQNNCETVIYYSGLSANYSSSYIDGIADIIGSPNTYNAINPMHSSLGGGRVFAGINDVGGGTFDGFDLSAGLYYFGRTASSGAGSVFVRKGSASRVTGSSTSNRVSQFPFYLGAYGNTNVTQTGYGVLAANRSFGFYSSGRLLTTTEEASLKTAWDTYMTSVAAIPVYTTIGTLYNVSSWSNLNDFTNNGATVSATSNQLQFTGGANTFTQTLDLSSIGGTAIGATKLSKWTQTFKFIVPTITASTNWIGVGLRSSQANGTELYGLCFRMDLMTATQGIMRLYQTQGSSLLASTSAMTITAGDVVSMTLTLTDGIASFSGFNVTTASTPITGVFNVYGQFDASVTNTGHFAIFNGGNANVTSWTVSSNEYTHPKVAIMGDSKTQGYDAQGLPGSYSIHGGYTYLMQNFYGPIVNLGGSSDDSRDYITRVYEIINWIQPQTLIIAGVSNDIRRGISSATWQANISSIISQCQAAGIRVVFWTGLYETSISQAAVSTWANAGIGCEVWDGVGIVISLDVGNVHPNNAGHVTFANYALSKGKLPPP